MLIDRYSSLLTQGWRSVFAQQRTCRRAIEHAVAMPCVLGRRTISRTICALGRGDRDWSADYKIYSRSRWSAEPLFQPVLEEFVTRFPDGPIAVGFDDTTLRKTGRKIATAFWQRDPLSPPFHLNFICGLRFIQGSMLFPHYREGDFPPRGFPVVFREAPAVKKPGKRATEQERKQYLLARKQNNLSTQTVEVIRRLRNNLDEVGASDRTLLAAMDGSFCNRTLFKANLDRTDLLARCRKDARLCFPAAGNTRRKYDPQVFTPEQVRQRDDLPYQRANVYYGGRHRELRYKEVAGVLWKRGAGTRPLRLIVIAPVPYKVSPNARKNYRDPAYLLTTDLASDPALLVQTYFDRWQIEVNNRDEKDLLGVGQAQVRSPQSVSRHPSFAVASYSTLLLAALREHGPGRDANYPELPKWRKQAKRPSALDLLTLLRRQINEASVSLFQVSNFASHLMEQAAT